MALKKNTGEKTLFASVLMSAPGPLVVGIALFYGRSSTQLADFIRRTAELAAIVISWIIFRKVQNQEKPDAIKKQKLEHLANISVGVTMCLSGPVILFAALFSSDIGTGNVIPGLVIAILGIIVNSFFWMRYRGFDRKAPNAIFSVQSRLYRAKTFVDVSVATALTTVAIAPGTELAAIIDIIGSLVVAAYLTISGVMTILGKKPTVTSVDPDDRTEVQKSFSLTDD